jgi:predicted TIM-barrel fold metal-dependent hydrolase
MLTVDSQVHAYERNHPGRPWVGTLYGPAEVTGDQMVAAMDAVGVDGAILVSPFSMYRHDASYALQVFAAHPTRFRLVKPVDPTDPAVVDTIADWAGTKATVGIRIFLRDNASTDPADPAINRVLATAAHDNVAVKISGACTLSREPFPYKDIWDPLARVFDAFGFDRCMWGTDWTRAVGMLTYEQGVEAFRVTDRLSDSDRAALMGDTLQRVYNWAASRA